MIQNFNKKIQKALIFGYKRDKGRNNQGKITSYHKGGGHKRLYRLIDFKRNKFNVLGYVKTIEYDPNRNTLISLINYIDGEQRYILTPEKLQINQIIYSGINIPFNIGNTMPLSNIPLGVEIHNLEFIPSKGGQIVRAAGTFAKIISRENNFCIVKLPSKELRLFSQNCFATIGRLGNLNSFNKKYQKAGQMRWLGIKPTVRGSAMNPIDHPHGGGNGKAPIGHKSPVTPWGKPTLGYKTRKTKKSDKYIIKKK